MEIHFIQPEMLRKIFLSLLVILIALIIWQWSLVNYGIRMGYGQLKIIWNAKPVETFLNDPAFPDSLKAKLHFIEGVRKYAFDSHGPKDTENYKTMYDQHGEE